MVAPAAVVKGFQTVQSLRNAENSALNGGFTLYTGSGREDEEQGSTRTKNAKGGIAALVVTIGLLVGGGAFLGSSHSLLAPAIEALFTNATDTQYASNKLRTTRIMKGIVAGEEPVVTSKWTGVKKYGKMSATFKRRLSKNGINVTHEGFLGNRVMLFTNKKGETIPIEADDFQTRYDTDPEFRSAYDSAKRGRLAGFFDDIATKIYKKLGISRNLFKGFKQTGDSDVDGPNYKKTMSGKFDGNEASIRTVGASDETKKNPETGEIEEEPGVKSDHESQKATSSGNDVEGAKAKTKDLISDVANSINQVVNWGCMVLQVGLTISTLVAANEIYQSINYFMGHAENISKMKAGHGDASALNEMLNYFTTPVTTTVTDLDNVKFRGSGEDTRGEAEEITITGSLVEANGMQMVLGYAPANTSTSALYSLERSGNAVLKAAGNLGATVAGCAIAKAAGAIVSIALTLTPGGIAKAFANIFFKIGGSLLIGAAVSAFLSFIIPTIAKSLFTNIFETVTGIPAGEISTRGCSAANTRLGRNGSGQSISSKAATIAYNKANNRVLAMDAEVDRLRYSPFDISNQNTFFGSIAYSLLPTLTSSKMTTVSTFLHSTATSLSTLMSSARAEGDGSGYMTTYGHCPNLEGIGVVGDMYCNPITTTDMSTIDLDPSDATFQNIIDVNMEGCDSEGNGCKIKKDSELGKYISYCDNRDSPFGIVDQNILNELSPAPSGFLGQALGAIPILGEILDLVDSDSNLENMKWATGQYCANTQGETDPEKQNGRWDNEMKYYQRYIEDNRILEQMGAYDEGDVNPVTAYEDAYEKEHPFGGTYEEYLSRISGLTLENTKTALAFAEYFIYVDEYDPTSRIAMTDYNRNQLSGSSLSDSITAEHPYFHSDDIVDEEESTLEAKEYIIYNDLRSVAITA